MNDELEIYGGKFRIELTVKCGSVSEVVLTTLLELDDLGPVNKNKIRDTIMALRSTMPVAEIKSEDQAWNKPSRDPAIGSDGKLTLTDSGLIAAKAGQQDLKKVLEGESVNTKTPVPGSRPA
jgi:hypothetical protein